jgi:hypothetical protein
MPSAFSTLTQSEPSLAGTMPASISTDRSDSWISMQVMTAQEEMQIKSLIAVMELEIDTHLNEDREGRVQSPLSRWLTCHNQPFAPWARPFKPSAAFPIRSKL